MNRPGRILVVDDEESWRNLLTDILQAEGFKVAAAGSISAATQQLADSFYHILFLDIRMKEEDANNIEGMQLLNNLVLDQNLGPAVKILVLSAHGTAEQMREAFHLRVSDFLSKHDYDDEALVAQVNKIFNRDMHINLSLEIHWKQVKGPEQFLINMELNGNRVKRDDPSLGTLSEELEDLLCRLFFDARSLQVRPLASGLSGANVLWVKPFYNDGPGQARVVKFGDFRHINREYQNYLDYVEKFIGGSTLIPNNGLRRTPRLGGIIYKLFGASGEQTESFGDFYARSETSQINQVLDGLFFETCKSWYSNPGNQRPVELTKQYEQSLGLTQQKLERALAEGLKSVQGKQTLRLNLLGDRAFTNPILAMAGFDFEETTYQCKTHGDLNENNVLVDNVGHTWLIDFDKTGEGHILRDVAELDCIVRFKLLNSDAATLQERLEMEEALCSARQFTDVDQLPRRFQTRNPALAKAYSTVVHLRTIARRLVLHSYDIKEYNIALFYYAINTIRFYDVPTLQRQHALLSASLLANQLA